MCRSKHVGSSVNFGIINSITKLHLVGIFTESSMMHGSMSIKLTSFSFREALTLNVTHEQLCPRDRLKKHIKLNTHDERQSLPYRTAERTQLSLGLAVICHILFLEKRVHPHRSDIGHPPALNSIGRQSAANAH